MDYAKKPLPQRLGLLCAMALTSTILCAQPSGAAPADGQQQQRKPPPEALDACKTAKAGQDCSFTSPHGTVSGKCFAPEGKPLACRPKNAPAGAPPAPKQ